VTLSCSISFSTHAKGVIMREKLLFDDYGSEFTSQAIAQSAYSQYQRTQTKMISTEDDGA
jgi:hypothetical protein